MSEEDEEDRPAPKTDKELRSRYEDGERSFVMLALPWAHLPGVDLRRADLTGANLSEGNFIGANLSGAELPWADLSGAVLRRADLSEANLSFANLEGANLKGTNLRSADLSGAGLRGADMTGANLSGADLAEAELGEVKLLDANLRGAVLRGSGLIDAVIDAGTYRRSAWSPSDLLLFRERDGVVLNLDEFPLAARSQLTRENEGLTLYFDRRVTRVDRFLLDGAILAELGPETDCRVAFFEERGDGAVVRLVARNLADLEAVADALWTRVWERHPGLGAPGATLRYAGEDPSHAQLASAVMSMQVQMTEMRDKISQMELREMRGGEPRIYIEHVENMESAVKKNELKIVGSTLIGHATAGDNSGSEGDIAAGHSAAPATVDEDSWRSDVDEVLKMLVEYTDVLDERDEAQARRILELARKQAAYGKSVAEVRDLLTELGREVGADAGDRAWWERLIDDPDLQKKFMEKLMDLPLWAAILGG